MKVDIHVQHFTQTQACSNINYTIMMAYNDQFVTIQFSAYYNVKFDNKAGHNEIQTCF